jgi:hypothetical protein
MSVALPSAPAPAAGGNAPQLLPYALGARRIPIPLGSIPFAAGSQTNFKLPKTGLLGALQLRFVGTVTVGTAGAATTPQLWNIIKNYLVTANLGYQYRNMDGETLLLKADMDFDGNNDVLTGSPTFKTYNPASATAQPVNFVLEDHISLNEDLNFTDFMVSCQTYDDDKYVSITFGAITDIIGEGGTEVITSITGTLFIDGLYFSIPDLKQYALPPTLGKQTQQCLTDAGYSGGLVVANADNTIHLTPVQGPRYMQIAYKCKFNGVSDTADVNSLVNTVVLKANSSVELERYAAQTLIQRAYNLYGRKLLNGWVLLDYLSDIGIPNRMSPIRRNNYSTEEFSTLDLILNLGAATVTGNTYIKIFKRIWSPVVTS